MLNTLLKKQMMEINQSFFRNRKTGKKRSRTAVMVSMALFAILMVFVIGGLFLAMSWMLSPLVGLDMSWMYFLIMAAAAIALGLFGSVFNTYSSLYQAKDNDLLLSLPIPVRYILFTRLTGVYLMGLMYSMIVFIPAIVIYLINADITPAAVAGPIIFALLLSVFVFVLACALGWAVAKVSSKLRNKSLVTVVLSLAFLGAYYVLYFRANELIKSLVANAASISSTVMSRARALYFIGDAAAGNMKALAVLGGSNSSAYSARTLCYSKDIFSCCNVVRRSVAPRLQRKSLRRKSKERTDGAASEGVQALWCKLDLYAELRDGYSIYAYRGSGLHPERRICHQRCSAVWREWLCAYSYGCDGCLHDDVCKQHISSVYIDGRLEPVDSALTACASSGHTARKASHSYDSYGHTG